MTMTLFLISISSCFLRAIFNLIFALFVTSILFLVALGLSKEEWMTCNDFTQWSYCHKLEEVDASSKIFTVGRDTITDNHDTTFYQQRIFTWYLASIQFIEGKSATQNNLSFISWLRFIFEASEIKVLASAPVSYFIWFSLFAPHSTRSSIRI